MKKKITPEILKAIDMHLSDFLLLNGFIKIEEYSYANDFCNVVLDENGYCIADNEGNQTFSFNHAIYWVIGYLTYYGYMDKNYKKVA